jgi:predicted RecB family nuclease
MGGKISREVLESYLHCKTKAHLKLAGQQGIVSDYEALLLARRQEVRQQAIAKILAKHPEAEMTRDVPLSVAALQSGPLFVLDATLEDDLLSLVFDGLKRVDGASKLGDFHYVPMLFHEGQKVGKQQRLLLEIYGLLLSQVQGRLPAHGVVWSGRDCKSTRVRLSTDLRRAERLLNDVRHLAASGLPPRLILNDHCPACEFRQPCHHQAAREDNISLLRSIRENEAKAYARRGILTLTQLAYAFRSRRKSKREAQGKHQHYHALQAMAIRDKRVYVFGTPEIPTSPVAVYLDIEGLPEEGFVYLIGMIIVRDGMETRRSFWADDREQEQEIFECFLEEIGRYKDLRVYCYGGYERTFLKRMRKSASNETAVERVLESLVNVLSVIYGHFYFPCHSNGLKDVAGCLGYSWSEPDASGLQSVAWRTRWEAGHAESWKMKLLTYNSEDCAALKMVTEVVREHCSRPDLKGHLPAVPGDGLSFARVEDTKTHETYHWGRISFVLPDFNYINKCSYFYYQRDHVYARTSRKIRKRQPRKQRNRKLPVSKYLEMIPESCPRCGCAEIVPIPTDKRTNKLYTRRSFDLLLTSGKIRRRVIECHGPPYQCSQCSHRFLSPDYERLDKHGHGLKSWTMYGHVQHRISLKTLPDLVSESFGLHVDAAEIHMFKSLMAHHYRPTYEGLLKKITTGLVLHADETGVQLKTGKGYVWVFSSIEEVIYMFRPTREGDFLRSLLADFHGVLVSDFYAAYDAIDCPQQKCLIHLMRDMNQDLLANPYDEELKSLTGPFAALLRETVTTIDRCGLRRRFLKKHDKAAAKFFRFVASRSFQSEAAEALRARLLKYREKLFAFIEYDGVSWNNNLAEHAIKRFAYYRAGTVGSLHEAGVIEYLTLLSICQTCRMRGVSFLRFLLSRQTDIDAFARKARSIESRPEFETYPVGFMPRRLAGLEKLRAHGRLFHDDP